MFSWNFICHANKTLLYCNFCKYVCFCLTCVCVFVVLCVLSVCMCCKNWNLELRFLPTTASMLYIFKITRTWVLANIPNGIPILFPTDYISMLPLPPHNKASYFWFSPLLTCLLNSVTEILAQDKYSFRIGRKRVWYIFANISILFNSTLSWEWDSKVISNLTQRDH